MPASLGKMSTTYVICINNEGHETSLKLRTIYQVLDDANAAARNQIRVIDESGEPHLYPSTQFVGIKRPPVWAPVGTKTSGDVNDPRVIACFVIYLEKEIVYQGSFPVFRERSTLSFPSKDGGVFGFRHLYEGTECTITVSYAEDGSNLEQRELVVPINRSKTRWKRAQLGETFSVNYRCVFEDPREIRKVRRKTAAARAARDEAEPEINLYYVGEGRSGEDS